MAAMILSDSAAILKDVGTALRTLNARDDLTDMILDRDPTTEIIRAFKLFDDDDSGRITYRNLKKIAR
ncbi:hypothetical protein PHET_12111 [Paragonimus heterotremus]|uniref:EF-hand domain-containing protein n=1 Tax=Paragonimus heterotremus TaxID=100268 RepID=A0A8J4SIF2_9TREM|nr:hypothetical protein PHET_12111 [Paragonimus heterotremus]